MSTRGRNSRVRARAIYTEQDTEFEEVEKTGHRSRSRTSDIETGSNPRHPRDSSASSKRVRSQRQPMVKSDDKRWWEHPGGGYALFIRLNMEQRKFERGAINLELKRLSCIWQGMPSDERQIYEAMALQEANATGALTLLGGADDDIPPVFMGANAPSASSGNEQRGDNAATASGSQVPPVFMMGANAPSASSGNEQRGDNAATASGSQVPPVAQAGTPEVKNPLSFSYWYGGLLSFGRIHFN